MTGDGTGTPATEPESAGGKDDSSEFHYEPRPRWVVVLVVAGALLAVLVLFLLISGGGHGPGRHLGQPAAMPSGPR